MSDAIKTKCIQCGRTYINYNDLCTVCRGVKRNDILDHIDDGINIEKEQDMIYNEIEYQTRKDYPLPHRTTVERKVFKGFDLKKMEYPRAILMRIEENRIQAQKESEENIIDVGDEGDKGL
jgi:hypothetical protein